MYSQRDFGRFRLTSFHDGFLRHDAADILRGITAEDVPALLEQHGLSAALRLPVNAFLIEGNGMTVLVDTGGGVRAGPDQGDLAASMASAGVRPAAIDLVILTHLHPDHIGGLLDEQGAKRFESADVLAPRADVEFFLDDDVAANAPPAFEPMFTLARAVRAAYGRRFSTATSRLPSALEAVPLPGHSPGHTGYRLRDGNNSLLIWGDIVHCPELQIPHPELGVSFDADPLASDRSRLRAFAEAVETRGLIAGMHMPFPGFARLDRTGTGYAFEIDRARAPGRPA